MNLLYFIIFSFLFSTFPATFSDITADKAALLALRSSLKGRSLLWNLSNPTPCSWVGVHCQFNRVTELRLPGMALSGQIPASVLGNLTSLITLSLRFNTLTGEIPNDIYSLKSLRNLYLQGEIPKTFSGGAIAGIVIGSVVGVLVIVVILVFVCCRKRSSKKEGSKDVRSFKEAGVVDIPRESVVESGSDLSSGYMSMKEKGIVKFDGGKRLVFFGNVEKSFDLEDLLRASAEVLGKGTFGTAYKAVLERGMVVAVKRLKDVVVSEKEYKEKIEGVGKMDHENLVPLRAYYYGGQEKLLVYDYMSMGSLSALLHGNGGAGRTPLNWETRLAIALGAARGIAYLHLQGSTVSHGNIKSSNVLLTSSYEARVSDFGLAQLVGPNTTPNHIDGYRAPEVTDARKVSRKADVYSFGVLLLELLTGKSPTHALLNEEGTDLPKWVHSVVKEDWTSEVFDLELLRYQNVEDDMVQLLQLAVDCAAQYPEKRPSMTDVTRRIEELFRSQHDQEHQHTDSVLTNIDPDSM
ncbi:Receptor-like kinase 902 [Heracleum sosnowskyi]|uniref:Receptor-like kinase 902 n=1 Tax=Heracleum sosnowskyi TaxID=360622 RepID=A0AAD8H8M8_9APIA|nr:Receptor-like kinase 902 [Heracleum sosnowskyi]